MLKGEAMRLAGFVFATSRNKRRRFLGPLSGVVALAAYMLSPQTPCQTLRLRAVTPKNLQNPR
jgi:hypothetical protein